MAREGFAQWERDRKHQLQIKSDLRDSIVQDGYDARVRDLFANLGQTGDPRHPAYVVEVAKDDGTYVVVRDWDDFLLKKEQGLKRTLIGGSRNA
ncbi:MAG: hypothetical protein NT025_02875 [bacterium]|nr:hypothetical protein [bacterium]